MAAAAGDKPRRRVLVAPLGAVGETLRLGQDTTHYIQHVLRLGVGDRLTLFDGEGREAICQIESVDRRGVDVQISERSTQPPAPRQVRIAVAIPKAERSDWIVEKLTELGAAEIQWLVCEHSVLRKVSSGREERWRRVAEAAARQCGRADLPRIQSPVELPRFLADRPSGAQPDVSSPLPERLLVAHRDGAPFGDATGAASATRATLVVGPEGGLSRHELDEAREAGYVGVSFGRWTLRVETAAISGAAVLLGA